MVGHISHQDETSYELFVTIIVQGEIVGTLALAHNMDLEQSDVNSLILIWIVILIIVAILFLYVIHSNYKKNKQLSKTAYYNPLIGLPNIRYLQLRFNQFKINKQTNNALMLVNVSEFKSINMVYGFDFGNKVLIEIAKRLNEVVDDGIDLIRLDGDRFILLMEDYKDDKYLQEIATKIMNKFSDAFVNKEIKKYLHVRIGVVKVQDKSQSLLDFIQKASIAAEKIESSENDLLTQYDSELEASIKREELIAVELQEIIDGVDAERLSLHYQPQLNLKNNQVQSIEALARLNSKYFGSVAPLEFITIAEKNHLIYDLGQLILRKASRLYASFDEERKQMTRMAVNSSGIQLVHAGFVDDVKSIINEFSIEPNHLEIEITESIVMDDVDNTMIIIDNLHNLGVIISLDDCGTGHSSFYRLSEFNVDTLKIDRSFINQITRRPSDLLITKEIIQMAHKFNLLVVAEGVENEAEYTYLKDNNCDLIQGYYFSKPLNEKDLIEFLDNLQDFDVFKLKL